MKPFLVLPKIIESFTDGRLHHALLFTGPEVIGKVSVVENFLAFLSEGLKSNDLFASPLNREQILDKIKRGFHPDLLRIKSHEGSISVDDVRSIGRALSYAPLEAKKRIVLVEDAGAMNAQAANALLKLLEEPPHHTMFFLFTNEANDLMPTILSRCQELRFAPPDDAEILNGLKELFADRDAGELQRAIIISGSSTSRAKSFLEMEDSSQLFQSACEQILNLWEKSPRIPSAIVQWVESISDAEKIHWIVDIWEILLRDLSISAAGMESDSLQLPEFRVRLRALVDKLSIPADMVAEKKSALHRFRVFRELNGNLKLDFLALICDLNFSVGKRSNPV